MANQNNSNQEKKNGQEIYKKMLTGAGLEPTDKRLRVLKAVSTHDGPMAASKIHETLNQTTPINRVTVYRILDLLVEKKIVEKISTGGRAFCYGLAPNEYHPAHPHFYCKSCGQLYCLNPDTLKVEIDGLKKTFPGRIDKFEMRLDGICQNCLKKGS